MAIVKFINAKNEKVAGLIRAIDYIVNEKKTEIFIGEGIKNLSQEDKESMFIEKLIGEDRGNRAINYITKDKKTHEHLISGINCSPESAFNEMMITKKMYNKENGRQFIHFTHSYSNRENIDPKLAHEISLKLIEHPKFKNFQILAATHVDREHIHTHFVLNTVNVETGLKWQLSTKELKELTSYSNKLCKEYGLKYSFANVESNSYRNNKYTSRGEYRAKEEYRSWKHELSLTINECMKVSKSKEEFIKNMEKLNYKVRWEDSRKYITFTTSDGKHKCRNIRLEYPEKYNKEELLKRFELNQQIFDLSKGSTDLKENTRDEVYKDKHSWKYPLFVSINDALKISTSKEDFIKNMWVLGYKVRWEDSRKDITFTLPDGRKCNNDKLHPPGRYTKEALLKQFALNKEKISKKGIEDIKGIKQPYEKSIDAIKDTILNTSKLLEQNTDNGGSKDYPLSYLEGQAIKEKMIEATKGEGLDWEKDRYR